MWLLCFLNTQKVYYVNLQTEVKKKVLLDTEYLSFRWNDGFDRYDRKMSLVERNWSVNNISMRAGNNRPY